MQNVKKIYRLDCNVLVYSWKYIFANTSHTNTTVNTHSEPHVHVSIAVWIPFLLLQGNNRAQVL